MFQLQNDCTKRVTLEALAGRRTCQRQCKANTAARHDIGEFLSTPPATPHVCKSVLQPEHMYLPERLERPLTCWLGLPRQ